MVEMEDCGNNSSRVEIPGVCWLCLKRFNFSAGDHNDEVVGAFSSTSGEGGLGNLAMSEEDQCQRSCIYIRFLNLISRYLKMGTSAEVFLKGAKDLKEFQVFCVGCQSLVGYLCDLYAELEGIKLRLVWKLGEMEEVMSAGRRSVSRKLYRGLLKVLMEKLNVNSMTRVEMFRKLFQLKCKAKAANCAPKPLVARGLLPEYWTVGYPACKLMMMRLIVVFLLASSKVTERHPHQTENAVEDVPKTGRIRRRGRARPPKSSSKVLPSSKEDGKLGEKIIQDKPVEENIKTENILKAECSEESEKLEESGAENDFWTGSPSSPILASAAEEDYSDIDFQPNNSNEIPEGEEEEESPPQKRWNLRKRTKKPTVNVEDSDSDSDYSPRNEEEEEDKEMEELDDSKLETNKTSSSGRGWPRVGELEPTLPCPKCKKMLLDKRSLASHLIAIHNTRLTYSCVTCGQKFIRWKDLRNHKRAMHRKMKGPKGWSKKPRKCFFCPEEFSTLAELATHRQENHKGVRRKTVKRVGGDEGSGSVVCKRRGRKALPHKCSICDELFSNAVLLVKHRRQDHNVGRNRNRNGALRKNRSNFPRKCTKCEEIMSSEKERRDHWREQHRHSDAGRPSRGPTKCTKCDEIFPTGKEMIEHRRQAHGGPKPRSRSTNKKPQKKQCKTCSETFSTREELKDHQKTVHKIIWTKHECPICYRTVVGKERFENHVQAHENNTMRKVELFYCEVCGQHFYKDSSLTKHMTNAHKDLYTCFLCKTDLSSGKLLRDHLVTHEKPEKFFHCMTCFRGFSSQQFFDIHRKVGHRDKRRHHCDHDLCNEIFDSVECLNEHLQKHAEEAREKGDLEWGEVQICKICGKGFIQKYNFTMHGLTHTPHNEDQPGYTCPVGICGKTVRYLGTLLTHYNRMHGLGLLPCKCFLCGKAFGSVEWYRQHVRQCGGEGGDDDQMAKTDQQYSCPLCGEKFENKKGLVDHKVFKHLQKRRGRQRAEHVQCPEPGCGEMRTAYQLNIHLARVHGKGDKYPCEHCGKLFIDMGHLKDHLIIHQPPRHFCDICGRGFKKPHWVKSHKAVAHTENRQKSFTCHECGMSYFTKQGLKYHVWGRHTQHTELRHRCHKCGRGYGRKLLLTMHLKNCTGEGVEETKRGGKGKKRGEEEEMSDRSTSSEEEEEKAEAVEGYQEMSQGAPLLYPQVLPPQVPPFPSTSFVPQSYTSEEKPVQQH